MSNILTAINIAAEAHACKFRPFGNIPFLTHPARVAAALALKDYNQEIQCIGWLHDVQDEGDVQTRRKFGALVERHFPTSVVTAVHSLAADGKGTNERHARLLEIMPSMSDSAKIVKAYSRADNLRDLAYRIRLSPSGATDTYTLIGRTTEQAARARDLVPLLEGGDAAEVLGSAIEDVFNAIKGN